MRASTSLSAFHRDRASDAYSVSIYLVDQQIPVCFGALGRGRNIRVESSAGFLQVRPILRAAKQCRVELTDRCSAVALLRDEDGVWMPGTTRGR